MRLAHALPALAAALLVWTSGCSFATQDEMTTAVTVGERPVAMEGTQPFFNGRVSVKVTLSRGIGRGLKQHNKDEREAYTKSDSKVFAGNPVPPVTLHLLVTNLGSDSLTVNLIDFNSDLGNFVIDPDTLVIAPGQTAEPLPMVSALGVNADILPFIVTLRVGGTRESRTFPVKSVLVDPATEKPIP